MFAIYANELSKLLLIFQETDGLDFLAMEIGQNGGRACLPSKAVSAGGCLSTLSI